eukprot:1188361-Prorocentrum_minimum.AAC.2
MVGGAAELVLAGGNSAGDDGRRVHPQTYREPSGGGGGKRRGEGEEGGACRGAGVGVAVLAGEPAGGGALPEERKP